jgi:bacteriocin-like protein
MKKFISIAIAFLLVLSVIPAMAGDQTGSGKEPVMSQEPIMSQAVDQGPVTLQAFSKLAATEREALTPLTEKELASIEGGLCIFSICTNAVVIGQANASVLSVGVVQTNITGPISQTDFSVVLFR